MVIRNACAIEVSDTRYGQPAQLMRHDSVLATNIG
jgi:hypothetical protein